ncbi:NAD(P)-dependent oxidoreductase [Neobacillus sp. OS1-2]|uniref:NAD-dependent epimerase/dehydratase family protein n=1 Tax=Neobacillus sp. OS1-2 TaxID=3070680 RepID=UPI0027E1178B|nr:NAD(P)-dependent oxidoreductase [Neobacillus sp. OS1-2]WML39506.1 NAD(P)-dependent oxidoreductase [Neobacillus sp. OS1-2]
MAKELADAQVFITGATGYIGALLAKRLLAEGCQVHILVRSTSKTNLLDPIIDNLIVHVFDGSYESVCQAIQKAKPDLVFHLASFASVTIEASDIEHMIDSNVLLGTFLSEAMGHYGVENIINTSSYSQHYGQQSYLPNSLYAATKQAFEDILLYYSKFHNVNVINLVLFDNFGPNDPRNKIMNLINRAMREGYVLPMSPGEQLLDLLYIDNVIDAFIVAASYLVEGRGKGFERYAVSSGKPIKLKDLVQLVGQTAGKKISVGWGDLEYRPGEIMIPWSKGEILPGWKPRISLVEGILLFLQDNDDKRWEGENG